MTHWKRQTLDASSTKTVTSLLQGALTDLIDLGLQLKQAHWNVQGRHFRAIHLQLDEILEDVREAQDEVAERMSTLGIAPDGRRERVEASSRLPEYPPGFIGDDQTLSLISERMQKTILFLRDARAEVAEPDAMTEDLLIATIQDLEKHLWMLQAQEKTKEEISASATEQAPAAQS